MKYTTITRAIALLTLLSAAPAALAQTPALLTYQGRVQTGTPAADFTGTGQFKFALMQGTTATRLWVNNGPTSGNPVNPVNLTVTNGLYSVLLGDTTTTNMAAIPPSVFANPDVRLRVWFNNTLLSPDQRLAPTGYLSSVVGAPSFEINNGTTPGFQVVPGTLLGVPNAAATTLEMTGLNTLGIMDNLAVDNDLSFPGYSGHTISVGTNPANQNGNALTVRAGNAGPAVGNPAFARNGGDLYLAGALPTEILPVSVAALFTSRPVPGPVKTVTATSSFPPARARWGSMSPRLWHRSMSAAAPRIRSPLRLIWTSTERRTRANRGAIFRTPSSRTSGCGRRPTMWRRTSASRKRSGVRTPSPIWPCSAGSRSPTTP